MLPRMATVAASIEGLDRARKDQPTVSSDGTALQARIVGVDFSREMLRLGLAPARLKAFVLNLDNGPDTSQAREFLSHLGLSVFLEEIGPFRTTRFAVQDALRMHRQTSLSDHLEIETYTWDVLPARLKIDLIESIAREYDWVLECLRTKQSS